ncbi:Ca2+-binding RTX toxin-like protein [Inquilinus ginsengisoli]|uniref:Ca2+-binding RTX toxin-like protein n=1 Tax=Inquilinus ginsengisoli TaxID=363840 RepID=A0ABU1JI87_9PROT|nr:calcium-binding protein [Inquilinus ginsengisoli]MDR6288298.1 Ca2+-binding RTX toxin-like protein [Inquilinus ginsengisoli]
MAVINGDNNANILNGTTAADQINGLGGDDTINAGRRPTAPGSGADVVDGGTGSDTLVVDASAETQAVQLFTGGSPTFQVRSTSGNLYVDAYNMERVQFTGGSGDDQISTGERGGTVNGGAGIDSWSADLSGLFANVSFILGTTTAIAAAGLTSILNLERISLSTGSGNDTVTGGARDDNISTGDGNDVIDAKTRPTAAGSGTDTVDGGLDADTLIVNAGAETQGVQLFSGGSPTFQVRSTSGNFYVDAYNMEIVKIVTGSGADQINTGDHAGTIDGGAGIDWWLADLSAVSSGMGFALGTSTSIAAAGLTSILGIERITLITGGGNDLIYGGAQADSITTNAGNDTINAKTRPIAGGTDTVDGGLGTDTLVVDASAETQAVQLFSGGSPTFQVRSTSGNFYVDAYNMEIVKIITGVGADQINTGNHGGTIDGGGGIDWWLADLSALTSGVGFALGTTTAIAAAGLTSILGLERITLTTGGGNDVIVGGNQADTITTGAGNDAIDAKTRPIAGGTTDTVDGGVGTDTLVVNAGAETQAMQLFSGGSPTFQIRSTSSNFYVDAYNMETVKIVTGSGADQINTGDHGGTVDGGGGIDWWLADLSALTTAVGFALGTSTAIAAAGLTSILNLERITLTTGSGNDLIYGGAQADSIATGAGNDTIDAKTRPAAPGSGTDTVDGGVGTDTLIVNAGAETQVVQLFAGGSPSFQVRSTSGNFYVDAYNMERVQFTSGAGADTANGLNGDDTLSTGAGNDVLHGGRGADTLTGGAGTDRFDYDLVLESNLASGKIDSITDFAVGIDDLDLTDIDANNIASDGNQAFIFIGGAGFSGVRGQLRAVSGVVEADVNGDGVADFRVLLTNGAVAGAADLLL